MAEREDPPDHRDGMTWLRDEFPGLSQYIDAAKKDEAQAKLELFAPEDAPAPAPAPARPRSEPPRRPRSKWGWLDGDDDED